MREEIRGNIEMDEQSKEVQVSQQIDDRKYLAVNLLLGIFAFVLLFFSLFGWPVMREARIVITNNTGEECYVALLSTDTENYGVYGKHIDFSGQDSAYWEVIRAFAEDNGMSEQEAEEYAQNKKSELELADGQYAFEKYRELMEAFSAYERGKATHIIGVILYGFLDGNASDYPPYEIWKGIADYKDGDGYRFIHQVAGKVSKDTAVFALKEWDLPERFKFLVYWPDSGRYAVSDVWQRTHILNEYRISADTLEVEDCSGRETIPAWIILVSVVAVVGGELILAWLLGAREKTQLVTIAVVSLVLHTIAFAAVVLTGQAVIVDGSIVCNALLLWVLLFVVIPAIEIPIYVNLLRPKSKYVWLKYKCCEFTLFINWAVAGLFFGVYLMLQGMA